MFNLYIMRLTRRNRMLTNSRRSYAETKICILFLDHVFLDPGQEVGDFGENAGESLAFAVAPRNNADDVEKALLVAANQRTAGVSHAGGDGVSAEANHARLDQISPGGLQVGVGKDGAVGFLELGWRDNTAGDSLHGETPAGEPAVLSAVVIVGLLGHAGQSSVRTAQVHFSLQLDQSDVVLNLMGSVEVFVDDDLLNIEGLFSSVAAKDVPFTSFDRVFGGSLGLPEAMSGAENPVLGDQGATANVLFGNEEEGGTHCPHSIVPFALLFVLGLILFYNLNFSS